MLLAEADCVAAWVVGLLGPHCTRIEIAGSVRRRSLNVGDVEVVCIPKLLDEHDLFAAFTRIRSDAFVKSCGEIGAVVKGSPRVGKYVQLLTCTGVQVDLFAAVPGNWGLIFAIRTGSARFSHEVLARGWCRAGFQSVEGWLHRRGSPQQISVHEEADLFRLIGVPWVRPEARI